MYMQRWLTRGVTRSGTVGSVQMEYRPLQIFELIGFSW
jgi:hypothetical protein